MRPRTRVTLTTVGLLVACGFFLGEGGGEVGDGTLYGDLGRFHFGLLRVWD